MFRPPRCPYRQCPNHARPEPDFCIRFGFYEAKCRAHRIPRFRCRRCRRTFSRQTFRMDYRDHRPHLNAELFKHLASGIGLRQTARVIGLSLSCTQLKFRKVARHLRRVNLNLRGPLPADALLQLDEIETFEGRRSTRPLSVPTLIEARSRFLVWAEAAPIRPRGKMTEKRRKAVLEDEKRFGKRRDLSRRAVTRTLRRGADMARSMGVVALHTDQKSTYPGLAASAFGRDRLQHTTTNSKVARTKWNPLFPINHTEAMMRDLMGRLRRESWLVSEKRRYLDLGLQLFASYRNYVRRRFNTDEESPAQILGVVDRRLTFRELLTWRQDWGALSIPLVRAA